jgi:hypothetical protein
MNELINPNTVIFVSKPSDRTSSIATLALSKKVTFICPIYNTFPLIISSLLLQTYDNWELYLVHDGPNSTGLQDYVNTISDTRIIYKETLKRKGLYGAPIRQLIVQQIKTGVLPPTDYIVITNDDNYHVPIYIESYLLELCKDPSIIIGGYCSQMIHNYVNYEVMNCKLERGYLDWATIMFRADVACDVGIKNITEFSSDWFYFYDVFKKYGIKNIVKVSGCLLVHN